MECLLSVDEYSKIFGEYNDTERLKQKTFIANF